jgi:hypothetical protein
MEVCFLASGELLAVLDVAEFEGQPGKALKQSLASEVGVTRFRLRIFMDGTEIQDHGGLRILASGYGGDKPDKFCSCDQQLRGA